MGEVWKAHDTRLGRDVAIKICREEFTAHFEREARAIAALNHPNICQLYDVGPDYLVMELIDGPTLQERIEQGALPVEEALNIATQIAAALDAAHEKGIVHRDLKPANIKLTPGGVKVLDFGLAKIADAAVAGSSDLSHSPTVTMGPTTGMILGTAAYMSPEQAKGRAVDKRADIWAFGVVLYEMLTGSKGFHGDTLSEILASILRDDVDANALPTSTPAHVRALLRHCLQKDPKRRLRDIGDVHWDLEEPFVAATAPRRSRLWLLWPALAVGLSVVAVAGWLRPGLDSSVPAEFAFTIVPPPGVTLDPVGGGVAPEISPDGRTVLYRSRAALIARSVDSLQSRTLNGLQGVSGRSFWSPDSKSVAFLRARALMRVRLPDGAPELIGTVPGGTRGGTWNGRGTILMSSDFALYAGAAAGGELKEVEVAGLKTRRLVHPQFIAGGDDVIFLAVADDLEEGEVYLATLRNGKAVAPVRLLKSDTAARYTGFNGGRLLFIRNDTLYSQKLDLKSRKLAGEPEVVAPDVASGPGRGIALGDFSVSQNGVVVWRPGKAALSQVTTFDRHGNVLGTSGAPSGITSVTLSPDESRLLAYGNRSWLLEPDRPARVALSGEWRWLLWSPDGSHFFGTHPGGNSHGLVERAVTGSDSVRELGDAPGIPVDVSADGKDVLWISPTGGDVASLRLDGTLPNGSPEPVVRTGERVGVTRFSPDGQWIVYVADSGDSRSAGIFVQPFKRPGLRTQVAQSKGGQLSGFPEWRKDGKEIVYVAESDFWSVSVENQKGELRFGAPQKLFSGFRRPAGITIASRPFAISRDGSRIYAVQGIEQTDTNMIHVKTMRETGR
jgi:serine/threonine protein kinase